MRTGPGAPRRRASRRHCRAVLLAAYLGQHRDLAGVYHDLGGVRVGLIDVVTLGHESDIAVGDLHEGNSHRWLVALDRTGPGAGRDDQGLGDDILWGKADDIGMECLGGVGSGERGGHSDLLSAQP